MDKVPFWKPLIIVLVVLGCALQIIPPSRQLKPGLDLAGGTTLIYQVDIQPGSDAQRDIDDTIVVLQTRVDPAGVRNLVWRQLAGHRIEIQMPIASKESKTLREAFLNAETDLINDNLPEQDIDAALRAPPDQRQGQLAKLAGGNSDRLQAMIELDHAQTHLDALAGPQKAAQDSKDKAQAALQALSADAPAKECAALTARLKALQADLTAKTLVYLDAQAQEQAARARVDAFNVDPGELERILALPNISAADAAKNGSLTKSRQSELDLLIAAHPSRKDEIEKAAQAYAAYENVKGTLDDPNDLIALLRSSGVLEFRVCASPTSPDVAQYVEQLATRGPRGGAARSAYIWVPIDDDPTSFADDDKKMAALKADPADYFARMSMVARAYGNHIYILLGNSHNDSLTHDQETPWQLASAYAGTDPIGFPAVDFVLDPRGGQLMGNLTRNNLQRPMAIVLDGKVMSAPTIQSQISTNGQITGGQGGFGAKELEYLIRTLKAGALKARLSPEPISIQTVGSEFGQDNLYKSELAAVVTLVVICVFMSCYYFVPGIFASFALIANVIIILGLMAATGGTFTLPGIAGIILTLGMAVDANVLVFERIREELDRKQPVRIALRLGYSKAMATIIDTHLTTLLTCVILYYVGTADVKGFAVTLGIGLLGSFFTAVFATHVLLDMWVRRRSFRSLSMLPLKYPVIHRIFTPSIDWYGKRYIFVGISLVLTVGGMICIAARGVDFLDIEFRSGTEVGFKIRGADQGYTLKLKDVRQRLDDESKTLGDQFRAHADALEAQLKSAGPADQPAIQDKLKQANENILEASYLAGDRATVSTMGETKGDSAGAFDIATLATDTKLVTDAIKDAFKDVLTTEQPVSFAGMDNVDPAVALRPPYVYPIHSLTLGDDIDRPDVHTALGSDYMGGVVVVLNDLKPALTIHQLRDRIESTRLQATQENSSYHPYQLIGLDTAASESASSAAISASGPNSQSPALSSAQSTISGGNNPQSTIPTEPTYSSIAVVARDDQTNYVENPDALTIPHGLADSEWQLVRSALRRDISLESVSNFSSQISSTIQQQAIAAVVLGWLVMLVYIWFRFGNLRFGVGAVLALIHDVITAIGLAALAYYVYDTPIGRALLLQPFRVNLTLVAAALTLIGYSVNDTIVVFDRIRENRGKLAVLTPGLINDSINQTISRTVLTAGTVLIACFCLYVLGGEAVRGFAFVMLVGSMVGCYSSIAVASPLLLVWRKNPPALTPARSSARPAAAAK